MFKTFAAMSEPKEVVQRFTLSSSAPQDIADDTQIVAENISV